MRFLLRLVVVVVVVLGALWVIKDRKLISSGREAGSSVDALVRDFDVHELGEELKRTGRIVRRKAGQVALEVKDATQDARTTAGIKAQLAVDPRLSALDISVDTTDGRVTLAGRADSADDIAHAIRMVLERDDVREVVSTIQVRPPDAKKVTLVR